MQTNLMCQKVDQWLTEEQKMNEITKENEESLGK